MERFLRGFYLTVFIQYIFAVEQNFGFEQECNILKSLESLEAKIQRLEDLEVFKKQRLESLATKIDKLENQEKGRTFTRWGRTSCPGNGTEMIYSGFVGGSWPGHTGAAADYICLPREPIYAHYEDTLQDGGLVYGAEYQFDYRLNRMAFFPDIDSPSDLQEHGVPCAVCRTKRTDVIMVPARNKCHDGWTLEYKGYLTSGYYKHPAASQYVCLDVEPEIVTGQSADKIGILFYFVEGRCGSLPCPPYINGRELTCAMCSK